MKEKLILDNLNLIYYVLKRMGLYDQADEYYDIGLIGLVKAANNFDPGRGLKFASSATVYIRNQILLAIRENKANSRKANNNTISFETVINTHDENLTLEDVLASDFDVEEYLIKKEQIESVMKAISTLCPDDKKLIKLYFYDNMRQVDIAKELNISQSYVARKVKKIIEKIQKKVNK